MTLESAPSNPQMPPLSDEGVIEILHFLEQIMRQFESRYFAQIHRYYQSQPRENLIVEPAGTQLTGDDPQF